MEVATATSGGSWGTFFAIWAVCSVAVFGLMKLWGKRENPERMLELFLLAVPFCLGGFHVWLSALASMYLLLCLMSCAKKGGLKISAGLPLAAFGLLPVSFFWNCLLRWTRDRRCSALSNSFRFRCFWWPSSSCRNNSSANCGARFRLRVP